MKTFIESVRDNETTIDDLDLWVDFWHESGTCHISLREYLGMNTSQYVMWMNDPTVIKSFI